LTKLACSFSIGDYVRITNDEEVVRNLQKGHGEWSENMKMVIYQTYLNQEFKDTTLNNHKQ